MKLWEYLNKKVCLTLTNGETIKGQVVDFCDEFDNDEGQDSIIVVSDGIMLEYFENKIQSIEEA
ncbi:hypothetical protein A9Q68_10040 [Streptococcus bovimastitidis]|uniref:LSM domain protein n=1 Tax=Streptococcus bovimastitidis TaxID=1856638 RepID=A0A1L8MKA6_9STRE|nr:hypothetical protein [Streptococcus bovimastitidis]OJF71168.1 hypothetical protein A9Q68_10040 [Streptococcus bovimastitidis]